VHLEHGDDAPERVLDALEAAVDALEPLVGLALRPQ
jgi:hypothetical protein